MFERPRPPRSAGTCRPKAPISFRPCMVWSSTFSKASFLAGSFTSCPQGAKHKGDGCRGVRQTYPRAQRGLKLPQRIFRQAPQAHGGTAPAPHSGLQHRQGIVVQLFYRAPFCQTDTSAESYLRGMETLGQSGSAPWTYWQQKIWTPNKAKKKEGIKAKKHTKCLLLCKSLCPLGVR